jgi:transcriptional regulator with GAF, ATPase, and Fis domain
MHSKDKDHFLPQANSDDKLFTRCTETNLATSHRFLEITNQYAEITPLLETAVSEIQAVTRCEAVGIRILDENGNIPYRAYIGFSQQFYEHENMLSIDSDRCMCISVINGSIDLDAHLFTSNGSFLTQSTSRLLSAEGEIEPGQTRNVCNRFGFESVALIPMRLEKRILGLIHLADSRENAISKKTVAFFEKVAKQLAIAVQRLIAENALKDSEQRFRNIGDNLPEGGLYQLVHTPDGRRYLSYASESFERLFQVNMNVIQQDATILYSMFAPEDLERVAQLEQESVKKLDLFNFEAPFHLPDGQIRWMRWHSKPSRLDDGTLIWDGVCLDITQLKSTEADLRKMRDALEIKVKERTSELVTANRNLSGEIATRKQAEIELKQAYDEIEKLNKTLEDQCAYLGEEIKLMHDYGNIIGESDAMKYVLYSVEKIAPTDTSVLLTGESGTGKELLARAIHHQSERGDMPLIKVDCAALPGNLIESELFGHEKGAFTSAGTQRIGRFELADGGTIFLDEIGELPLELQQKLLRVLQDGEYERLGSSKVKHTDVRAIAATNRNLEEDVQKGRFREDLWYRLNVFPLSIPPLRDRDGDIPILIRYIVDRTQRKHGKKIETIPKQVMDELTAYTWPGNVRELENIIERAIIVTQGSTLRLAAPLKVHQVQQESIQASPMKSLAEMEKAYILQALDKAHWNVTGKGGAADLLGLNPSTLRGRMRKHNIRRPS